MIKDDLTPFEAYQIWVEEEYRSIKKVAISLDMSETLLRSRIQSFMDMQGSETHIKHYQLRSQEIAKMLECEISGEGRKEEIEKLTKKYRNNHKILNYLKLK